MKEHDETDIEALVAAEISRFQPANRAGSSAPLGVHVVDWRRLADDKARDEWTSLRKWVEWFTVRYRISASVVPNCWWKHSPLVEELSALRTAHLTLFDANDTGLGPISWHERLTLALPRLSRAGAGCASEHSDTRPRCWDAATDETEWDAWTALAHAH